MVLCMVVSLFEGPHPEAGVGIRRFTLNPRLVRTLHGARSAWCRFPKQASLRVCTL